MLSWLRSIAIYIVVVFIMALCLPSMQVYYSVQSVNYTFSYCLTTLNQAIIQQALIVKGLINDKK